MYNGNYNGYIMVTDPAKKASQSERWEVVYVNGDENGDIMVILVIMVTQYDGDNGDNGDIIMVL